MTKWAMILLGGLSLSSLITTRANSARPVSPLDNVKEVAVSITVGGELAVDSRTATPLFASDAKGMREFLDSLKAAIVSRLGQAGIAVRDNADHNVWVGVFGGEYEQAGCSSTTFFMLEVSISDASQTRGEWPDKTLLGVAGSGELREALTRAATSAVDELIANRR